MRKVLSLVLACVLVLGMGTTAFAAVTWNTIANNTTYDGLYPVLGHSYNSKQYGEGTVQVIGYDYTETVRPGDEFILNIFYTRNQDGVGSNDLLRNHELNSYYKKDANGNWNDKAAEYYYKADRTDVRNEKFDVRVKVSEGSKVIDDVTLVYASNAAEIKVEYIDPFISTSDVDFDFVVYLTRDRSRISDKNPNYNYSEFHFTGNFENYSQNVHAKDDYVYTGDDTPVIKADDYVKDIEVDLGMGVSIFTKMFEGRKYYGRVHQDITSADDEILDQYPSIDTIFYLQTINLNAAGNYVTMDMDDKMFVYNADLQYVGTTSDKLPYSTKYYVSTLELDVEDASGIDSIPSGEDNANAPMGGDDVPENVNRNPGTGC